MPDPRQPDNQPADLAREIAALRREVEALNAQRFFVLNGSARRMLLMQFLRGMTMGLGTVVGASVLVSVIAYSLSQIDFIPVIGDWAVEIAREIRHQAPGGDAPEGVGAPPLQE
ncbi:hypothetical protein RGUI_2698 [Rhodovulum sp. P5]|uniref:DUF5665 domain-containing protein n=1 Tax=Rhodovulum sp. P5 TaxID=1564506 RepID=UPI0009C2F0FD|nr:DUF5665 domain-containing protein [Rhodovulum sp. P5]ARE40839.1 hypothetical protein RGUI_2698 [Rhodovulum sp. P5]